MFIGRLCIIMRNHPSPLFSYRLGGLLVFVVYGSFIYICILVPYQICDLQIIFSHSLGFSFTSLLCAKTFYVNEV